MFTKGQKVKHKATGTVMTVAVEPGGQLNELPRKGGVDNKSIIGLHRVICIWNASTVDDKGEPIIMRKTFLISEVEALDEQPNTLIQSKV